MAKTGPKKAPIIENVVRNAFCDNLHAQGWRL